ncbi:MAG: SAF domain-containing protein, partial [Nocardioidaceae bacterium]
VLAGLQAAAPPPPPTRLVLTAARDLPAGTVLAPDHLARVEFSPASVPAGLVGSVTDVVGRTTAAPLRAGEPLTDVRLVSGSLLEGYPGLVAAPVRIADPGAVGLLRVGDRVDVVAADPQGRSEAVVVAERAAVLALPRAGEGALASGGLVVLAVSEDTARALAASGVARYLSVLLRR